MDLKLKELVKSSWPKDKISDGMLLSMYFSPGCAGSEIRDLENANQIAEHPAEDAAYAAAAAQGSEQGSDQGSLRSGTQVSCQNSALIDRANSFQAVPDPSSGLDHLPDRLLYMQRTRPALTNRLRATTLVYRALIQQKMEQAIEKRRNDLNDEAFNPIYIANNKAALRLAQVDAEYSVLVYEVLFHYLSHRG
ncbi:hypothetical protein BGZ89_004689, partial [Linnemannia elongata]